MTGEFDYAHWRESWPDFIVQKDTAIASDLLKRYYSLREDGRPRYTGSRFESIAASNADPDVLAPADFVAVSMLSVDVPAKAAIRLLDRDAAMISELLQKIPVDVDLVDAEPSHIGKDSAATQLWNVLRNGHDGLGRTRTSKLLAAKRPRLLPIWDSFVQKATGLDTLDYWAKFQSVLGDEQRAVWRWLCDLRALDIGVPQTVSELRLLDILLWMSVETSTQKGSGHRR